MPKGKKEKGSVSNCGGMPVTKIEKPKPKKK